MSPQPTPKNPSKTVRTFLQEHFGGNTPQLHWYVLKGIRLFLTHILLPKKPLLRETPEIKEFLSE